MTHVFVRTQSSYTCLGQFGPYSGGSCLFEGKFSWATARGRLNRYPPVARVEVRAVSLRTRPSPLPPTAGAAAQASTRPLPATAPVFFQMCSASPRQRIAVRRGASSIM